LFEPPPDELPQAATVSIPAAKTVVTHHRLDIVISIQTREVYALHVSCTARNVAYNQTTYRVA
jgi:hypothetical protein